MESIRMDPIGHGVSNTDGPLADDSDADERRARDLSLREKNRYWNERPATRFVVYFCVFVVAEILVGITLHWIFHLI